MQQFDIIVVFIELLKTNNWVGVKIPRLGYLDPHPWFQAKYVKKVFLFKPMELILLQEKHEILQQFLIAYGIYWAFRNK